MGILTLDCASHHGVPAATCCAHCGKPLCVDCIVNTKDVLEFCSDECRAAYAPQTEEVYGVAGPTRGIGRFVVAHFRRHRARRPWAFVCRVAPESVGVCLAVAAATWALGVPGREIEMGAEALVLFALAVAPALEALLFQALPVFVARKCRARFSVQIVASVVPFALVHVLEGLATGLAAGLVGGFYFAFTYAHWRERSRWTAFWTTWVVHTFQNAIAVTLMLAVGEI